MIRAISSAQESIDISTFHLSDPAIIGTLQKVEKQGALLTVYSDPSSPKHPWQTKAAPGLWHEKILILDKKTTFVGSANLTEDSLRCQDNRVVGLYSPALAEAFIAEKPNPFSAPIGPYQVELWRLPHPGALERLLSLLHAAQKTIDVAMYTFTHPLLLDALIAAHQRGVYVHALLDSASRKAGEKLKKEGIAVSIAPTYPLMHRKEALIDHKIQILGSANWTKGAFKKNKDYFLILFPQDL